MLRLILALLDLFSLSSNVDAGNGYDPDGVPTADAGGGYDPNG
jgi:hypothetical protein